MAPVDRDKVRHQVQYVREGLGAPRTYPEAIEILVREKILPRERRETFLRMVRFRKRAVHLYDQIDVERVFEIVDGHLSDFEAFLSPIIERYFDDRETE